MKKINGAIVGGELLEENYDREKLNKVIELYREKYDLIDINFKESRNGKYFVYRVYINSYDESISSMFIGESIDRELCFNVKKRLFEYKEYTKRQ